MCHTLKVWHIVEFDCVIVGSVIISVVWGLCWDVGEMCQTLNRGDIAGFVFLGLLAVVCGLFVGCKINVPHLEGVAHCEI
jgi:hypothetical protein